MVTLEVVFQGLVIDVVLLLAVGGTAITDMATLVFISTVSIKLVIAVETLAAKATLWVSFKTTLVDGTGLIITILLMLSQLCMSEKSVLVGEDLLVSCTEITRESQLISRLVVARDARREGAEATYHITLLCLLFTWRCKSGHPRQATSQSSSGQLYRSSKTVSSKISSFSYWIPKFSSMRAKSFIWKSSNRRTGSSVKVTKADSV